MAELEDKLIHTIKTLHETVWEQRTPKHLVERWLSNFVTGPEPDRERLHALYLLANFMYFGSREMRALLKAVYRDNFKYPIVADIRRANGNTLDRDLIGRAFLDELSRTRFLGIGNPSESGCHLLYFFRQENALSKHLFINSHEIFSRKRRRNKVVLRWPR